MVEWAHNKRQRDDQDLKEIEPTLFSIYDLSGGEGDLILYRSPFPNPYLNY